MPLFGSVLRLLKNHHEERDEQEYTSYDDKDDSQVRITARVSLSNAYITGFTSKRLVKGMIKPFANSYKKKSETEEEYRNVIAKLHIEKDGPGGDSSTENGEGFIPIINLHGFQGRIHIHSITVEDVKTK